MKSHLNLLCILAILIAGCAFKPKHAPTSIQTPDQAIEIVKKYIKSKGGNPNQEEISARESKGQWNVLSWHIYYPENKGSSRFVPGGHTFYTVSPDGRVIDVIHGA